MVLPMINNPIVKPHNGYAIPFGILSCSFSNYEVMLYNEYLNIRANGKIIDLYNYEFMDVCQCMDRYCISLPKKEMKLMNIELEMIGSFLSKGYYLFFVSNHYYIPGRSPYKKYNRDYDSLLYGIDSDYKYCYIAGYGDYANYGQFELSKISTKDFLDGIYNTDRSEIGYLFLKVKDNFKPNFDLNKCIYSLKCYLESKDNYNKFDSEYSFGLDVYKSLINTIESIYDSKQFISTKNIQLLYEHKSLMHACFKFLNINKYFDDNELVEKYKDVVLLWEKIRNLCLEYNLTFKKQLLIKMVNNINMSVEIESSLLNKIINKLIKGDHIC